MQEIFFFFSQRRGLFGALFGWIQAKITTGLIKASGTFWRWTKHRSHDVGSGGHRVCSEREKCREVVEDGWVHSVSSIYLLI